MSNLFFYKILFMIEITVAESLLMFRLRKRGRFMLRFWLGIFALLGLSAAVPVFANNIWITTLVLMLEFLCTLPWLFLCYDEPWKNILFCGVAAYTLQHLAYGATGFVLSLFNWLRSPLVNLYDNSALSVFQMLAEYPLESAFCIVVYLTVYFGIYALATFMFDRRVGKGESMNIKRGKLLALVVCGLLFDIILSTAIMSGNKELPYINTAVEYVFNIFCCVLLLYVQYGMLYEKELEINNSVLSSLLTQKQSQYEMSKENIDAVNMKFHDIKHQIRAIGKSERLPDEVVKQIEKSIELYDSAVKTGNAVLDIILSEKSLLCNKNGIVLSVIADGKKLDFIKESDLYSIFGNALDNAIEGVMKLSDKDRRVIGLKIRASRGVVAVNIQNPCVKDITLNEVGLPVTDKADKRYHGFGLKSIKYVVENYGGNVSVDIENGYFNLNMIFPVTA